MERNISIVMPAYNEEENIAQAVEDFKKIPGVKEVVVANNNSKDRTEALAKNAGARVVLETNQGYGYACRRALSEAKYDYIILVEPDGTFDAKDVNKLMAYADEADIVLGTRTVKELIWNGANMGIFLKWGNWFIAKMIEVIYNGPHLSDAGCTYRLIKKDALKKIEPKFTVGKSHFSPEMIILAIKNGLKVVEIPVNYRSRKGTSKITGKKFNAFLLGLKMIWLTLKMRIVP